jgi:hypothetical protein
MIFLGFSKRSNFYYYLMCKTQWQIQSSIIATRLGHNVPYRLSADQTDDGMVNYSIIYSNGTDIACNVL